MTPRGTLVRQAFILALAGWVAAQLVIPYQLALQPGLAERLPLPLLVLSGAINAAVEVAIAVAIGLPAARAVGLRAPVSEALATRTRLRPALREIDATRAAILGVLASLVVVALDVSVFRGVGASLARSGVQQPGRFVGLLASFEGGITEEILLRLFVMSAIVWLLARVRRDRPPAIFWVAIVAAAVLFGAAHLPAAAALIPLTPVVIVRTIVLNTIVGLVTGWLYWRRGLESAMVAHFSADLVLHVALGA